MGESDARLAALLSRYQAAIEATRDAVWEWEPARDESWWNERTYELLEYDRSIAPSFEHFQARIHPEDRPGLLRNIELHLAGDERTFGEEYRLLRPTAGIAFVRARGCVIRGNRGDARRVIGVLSDITAQRTAELALRESEETFKQITDHIDQVLWLTAEDPSRVTYVSPAFETIFGISRQELYERPDRLLGIIHEQDRPRVEERFSRLQEGEYDETFRIVRPDGSVAWIRSRAFPIRDEHGRLLRVSGVAADITRERRLEEQLLESRKMESIGRLAGGVAHDFNNLLTVILGSTEFAVQQLPPGSPAAVDLEYVFDAADRAANLTAQLLAFARRQVTEPRLLDLNDLVRRMDLMLRRVIGEHIELVTAPAEELGSVRADLSQMEQVLLNLAVNARDAMPTGGKLTIETANVSVDHEYTRTHPDVTEGAYVMLAVTDNGIGMAPEVKEHIFEPFFTTKTSVAGTGLGLATCYGIVHQAGGQIVVYTEPGRGSTFKILLPRATMIPEAIVAPARVPPGQGHETILFVEDDASVRRVGVRILNHHGYRVLEASDGIEAVRVAEQHEGPIHLLVTDVVMPHMGGIELAARLREGRPGLRVLFTSGYTENSIVHHGVLDAGMAFLPKPYVEETLLGKVRATIDDLNDFSARP